MTSEMTMEESEDRAYDLQEAYVKEHYPGANVNYGWAVDEVSMEISSKVYGHGVLTTSLTDFHHTFEEFS